MSTVKAFIFFILISFSAATVEAGSPVWKVSKGSNYLYVGGTVHILSETDYPLPYAFELAYQRLAALVGAEFLQESAASQ